jgi:hypothetical protein
MQSGTIKLYTIGGMKIKEARYYSIPSRKSIIESWGCLYGSVIESKHFIHIMPDSKRYVKKLT